MSSLVFIDVVFDPDFPKLLRPKARYRCLSDCREPCPSSTADCIEEESETAKIQSTRSSILESPIAVLAKLARFAGHCPARYRDWLAKGGVQVLLATQIQRSSPRKTKIESRSKVAGT